MQTSDSEGQEHQAEKDHELHVISSLLLFADAQLRLKYVAHSGLTKGQQSTWFQVGMKRRGLIKSSLEPKSQRKCHYREILYSMLDFLRGVKNLFD